MNNSENPERWIWMNTAIRQNQELSVSTGDLLYPSRMYNPNNEQGKVQPYQTVAWCKLGLPRTLDTRYLTSNLCSDSDRHSVNLRFTRPSASESSTPLDYQVTPTGN